MAAGSSSPFLKLIFHKNTVIELKGMGKGQGGRAAEVSKNPVLDPNAFML